MADARIWAYDHDVPDDTLDAELVGYRQIAVATWRTAVEATGARPGDAVTTLVERSDVPPAIRVLGQPAPPSRRLWHVEGEAV